VQEGGSFHIKTIGRRDPFPATATLACQRNSATLAPVAKPSHRIIRLLTFSK